MTKSEQRYYSAMKDIIGEKSIKKKIAACEKQLRTLPEFVSTCLRTDGDLPPAIPCRDETPELYMRIGDWAKAERVIKFCMECNAYYPDSGNDRLIDLLKYQTAATEALSLIKETPGILQKDIYKLLKEKNLDDYSLKHFIRCSLQIKKVPDGGTNRLYAK